MAGTISTRLFQRGRQHKCRRKDIPTWGDELKEKKEGNVIIIFENWNGISVKGRDRQKLDRL